MTVGTTSEHATATAPSASRDQPVPWPLASSVWPDYPFVLAAYHFGSSVRGANRPDSDVDVAILLTPEAAKTQNDELVVPFARLQNSLERCLGIGKLDLVPLNDQGVVFQHNVLRTGRLVYERDRRSRALFEARVISWYCDFLPTLQLIERYHIQGRRKRAGLL